MPQNSDGKEEKKVEVKDDLKDSSVNKKKRRRRRRRGKKLPELKLDVLKGDLNKTEVRKPESAFANFDDEAKRKKESIDQGWPSFDSEIKAEPETQVEPESKIEPEFKVEPHGTDFQSGSQTEPGKVSPFDLPPKEKESRYRNEDIQQKDEKKASDFGNNDNGLGVVPGAASYADQFGDFSKKEEPSFFGYPEEEKDTPIGKVEDKETDELPQSEGEKESDFYNEPADKPVDFDKKPEEPQYVDSSQVKVADVTTEAADVKSGRFSDEEEKSSFAKLLEDAGIKVKHLVIAGGVIVFLIALVLFLVFGGWNFLTGLFESKGGQSEIETEVKTGTNESQTGTVQSQTETPQSQPQVSQPVNEEFPLAGLVNSYIFGLEFSQERVLPILNLNPISEEGSMVGIDSSIAAGQPAKIDKDVLVSYVDLLKQINNARKLDVYEYLNRVPDRTAALNDYIRQMNFLYSEAQGAKNTIVQQISQFSAQYITSNSQKNLYEKNFFDSISKLYGDDAYNYLELFVESSQIQVKEKAYYNALKTLNEMFYTAIKIMKPQIDSLILNADALIKGVRVYQVPGSTIDSMIIKKSSN